MLIRCGEDSNRPGSEKITNLELVVGSGKNLEPEWCWPIDEEIIDAPDPLGIEDQWYPWAGTMEEGPSVFAEIFAREYIQNSWDSIQAKKAELAGREGVAAGITFQFVELRGDDVRKFERAFGLADHRRRLQGMESGERDDQRLGDTVLTEGPDGQIRLLVASERGGSGMSGRWFSEGRKDVQQSRLRIALVQSTTGKTGEATGGSWGEGKKGVACASAIRTLGAYTCHPPHPDDEGVTRQFLGVTYWRLHSSEEIRHRGIGLLGAPGSTDGGSSGSGCYSRLEPLRNEAADEMVESLGIDALALRDPEELDDHGTSYLFVDPSFSPEDLARAIGRNWWPLLERYEVDIEVLDYEGNLVEIETREREELRPFIECFDVVTGKSSGTSGTTEREFIEADGVGVGTMIAGVEMGDDGWSYQDPEDNANLIALVRNDMVIAYQRSPAVRRTKTPFIRGTFVVEREGDASRILKMTEGHLHNEWKTDPKKVGNEEYADFAAEVMKKIHSGVKKLRDRFEDEEEPKETKIRAFQLLFSTDTRVQGPSNDGPSGGGPLEYVRDYGEVRREYRDSDPTWLRMEATATVSLRADYPKEEAWFRLGPGWAVGQESGNSRDQALEVEDSIVAPEGFRRQGRFLEGKLTKEPVEISWISDYFPDYWMVEPALKVESMGRGS
jgi:hypothetical protein